MNNNDIEQKMMNCCKIISLDSTFFLIDALRKLCRYKL